MEHRHPRNHSFIHAFFFPLGLLVHNPVAILGVNRVIIKLSILVFPLLKMCLTFLMLYRFLLRCSENMQHLYRRTSMSKCDFNNATLLKSHFGMGAVL